MSWIASELGAPVNLDYVEHIDVMPLDVEEGTAEDHGVFLRLHGSDATDDICVFSGTEEQCDAFLERLKTKLPMVKP